ncbi:MAG: restriction endonuclease subunit S, partial [Thermoguttaceae bacterium]|nr:restriction endonuclease subunit S [Thermoguttaceae bacterium]
MSRVKFGDVVKDCKEKIDRNNNSYEFYVAGDHMDTEDLVIRRKGRFATDDVGPAFIRLFRLGQVLYGSRRTYLKKVAVADFEGVTANTTFVFETKDESVLRQRLLPFIMLSDSFTEWSIKRSKGSTNPYVLFSDLADFEFELPDVKQQDKYVELLWSIWNVKEAYRKLLAATDELVKARFVEMFGDPIENPMNWETSQLENIAEIRIGPFGSLLHKDDYIQGGHPIVNPSHIIDGTIVIDPNLTLTDSKYEELSCYSLQVGDVVLGRRGEMGRCAVVPSGGYLCGTGSIIIRPKNGIKSCLLQRIISSSTFCKYIESMAVGVTMKNLNVSIVSSFQI